MRCEYFLQNPNEDTQWNDVLRQKGIIPEKEAEITEEDVVNMLEATVEKQLKGLMKNVILFLIFFKMAIHTLLEILLYSNYRSIVIFRINISLGKTFDDMDLDELNENEDLVDDEDDRAFEEYRFN